MRRWLLIVATLWPVVYMAFFFGVVGIATASGGGDPDDGESPIPFGVLIALHLLTMLVVFALPAIYMVDVFRNPALPEDRRVLWAGT